MRIAPNRVGYQGYTCEGIDYFMPEEPDCVNNKYNKLPAQMEGSVGSVPYENLSAIALNTHLEQVDKECGVFFDPFTGAFINMFDAFIEEHLDGYIEDECYNKATSKYSLGYAPPNPLLRTETCSGENNPSDDEPVVCAAAPWRPTIYLTVTGSSMRAINWCGELWQLPADSGERKEVCPTGYLRQLRQKTGSDGTWIFTNKEDWSFRQVGGGMGGLHLVFKQIKHIKNGVPFEKATATHWIRLETSGGNVIQDRFVFKDFFSGPDVSDIICNMHIYCTKPEIDIYDYRIRDAQFGSYTDQDNITYKWERGVAWEDGS